MDAGPGNILFYIVTAACAGENLTCTCGNSGLIAMEGKLDIGVGMGGGGGGGGGAPGAPAPP